jgi:hypothetical protein
LVEVLALTSQMDWEEVKVGMVMRMKAMAG